MLETSKNFFNKYITIVLKLHVWGNNCTLWEEHNELKFLFNSLAKALLELQAYEK